MQLKDLTTEQKKDILYSFHFLNKTIEISSDSITWSGISLETSYYLPLIDNYYYRIKQDENLR